ncbi:hypothetical protein LZ31DRAFT_264147 [Colletotrichum somersetense]|nr:hypothetical protein LZ31DRAFT_264147 [Colletotrichum somersetense]
MTSSNSGSSHTQCHPCTGVRRLAPLQGKIYSGSSDRKPPQQGAVLEGGREGGRERRGGTGQNLGGSQGMPALKKAETWGSLASIGKMHTIRDNPYVYMVLLQSTYEGEGRKLCALMPTHLPPSRMVSQQKHDLESSSSREQLSGLLGKWAFASPSSGPYATCASID